ncbi:hypothetical protein F5Y15DRAFT_372815 [Xylariaceae sp. FL0016]|nr:hypothetical protein F5Y15DRAFT_372815 [Xylariaceae sp. FL0016]
MKTRCSHLSYDVVGLLSFGHPLNFQTDETNRFLTEHLGRANHRVYVHMQTPTIPYYKLQLYPNPLFRGRERTGRLWKR